MSPSTCHPPSPSTSRIRRPLPRLLPHRNGEPCLHPMIRTSGRLRIQRCHRPWRLTKPRRHLRQPPRPRGGYMSPLTCPLPSPSTSRIRRLLPRLLMKLFLHHHPIGTIIDRIPSPRRRRSAIHAGRSINSIVRKITMISSASLRIKSSTRILQYPFKVGINHESEDLWIYRRVHPLFFQSRSEQTVSLSTAEATIGSSKT